ncbi:MAG: proline--tRNA ligase [Elusimicrobiales bacterium]|nr:proline--tRNA ligase [Elusimicrobiales bacterium]
MRRTRYFLNTIRETPSDADNISAKLMIKSGMIRKLASGIYEWLPLGFRVLKKVENIIREEMDKAGGVEVWLPVIQPKELWLKTGRWNVYGKELLRIKDRKDQEYCFAPTAEEVITDLVRKETNSHRQLPILLYQFGLKFRDEIRPRFGVMRSREFYMKDAYSFHTDEKNCLEWYWKLYDCYNLIFKRCGLNFRAVEAVTGAIGGNYSHEFMVLANTGEAEIAVCECGYAANTEKAEILEFKENTNEKDFLEMKDIPTPNKFTVDEVSDLLKIPSDRFIKTMFYKADESKIILALIRGDHQFNEDKIIKNIKAERIEKISEEEYSKIVGTKVGYAGPVGIKEIAAKNGHKIDLIIADHHLKGVLNGVSGANKDDAHTININYPRDYSPDIWADIKIASEGDRCLKCGKKLTFARGIEVGQVFKLGTKYSAKLECFFLDDKQEKKPMEMGCYGIGVSRTVAAAIEQYNDEKGIIWPIQIAPFHVYMVSVETEDENVMKISGDIYDLLTKNNIEVLWDDRDERAGVKFNDADLIGIPYRIVISKKTISSNEIEIKKRKDNSMSRIKISDIDKFISTVKSEI